jgi:hypothetical protein
MNCLNLSRVGLLAGLALICPTSSFAAMRDEVADALEARACFDSYWWDDLYPLGFPRRVTVAHHEGWDAVWADDFLPLPRARRTSTYFKIVPGHRPRVDLVSTFNTDLMSDTPDYIRLRREVFGGAHEPRRLRLPGRCAETEQAASATLTSNVIAAIGKLAALSKARDGATPERRRVVVARFSDDDPDAFAFTPDDGRVYDVSLHVPGSEGAKPAGPDDYFVRDVPERRAAERLRLKISARGAEYVLPASP